MHTSPQRWLVSSARLWASILLTCAAVGALPPAPVRAATRIVTNTNDSAPGSLRQALEDAGDRDIIVFDPSIAGGVIYLHTPLQVNKNLTIQGPMDLSGFWESEQTNCRVLEVAAGADVTLRSINIGAGYHDVEGGGILNYGTLVLDGCWLAGNNAGVRGGAVANYGSLTTLNGSFRSNLAGSGGAIYNALGATLSITGDGVVATREFHSNNATGNGGSIYNSGTMLMTGAHFYFGGSTGGHGGAIYNTGVATITSSQFEMVVASAGNGGAIANTGTLTMHGGKLFHKQSSNGADVGGTIWNAAGGTFTATETEWSNTHARARGGALATDGTATLTDCVLRGGTAPYAGGIHVGATGSLTVSSGLMSGYEATAGSGGAIYTEGTLHVFDSTIASNSALLDGGGIYIGGTQASEIRRTTLQQNSAVGGGGGISAAGRLVLENSTLFQNRAGLGGGLLVSGACSSATVTNTTIAYSGYGGSSTADGQGISAYGPLSLANSIVAYSTGGTDCYATATVPGQNLVEDGSCGNLSGDPLLATLQWNGGDTQTLALMAGSPAVDAGATSGCPATDQRGMARPQGAGCDLGAFEAGPPFGLPSGARTDAATSVGPTGATLNGLVFHLYWPTDVTFSYGLTEAYGATVPAAQSPIPTDPTDWENYEQVSVPISGLEPNRTYHFRVEGENAFGAAYGEDLTFTTPPIAPSVTTGEETDVTGTGATLHGTVNAHNSDATVVFEYGLTDAYGASLAGTPALATGNANTDVSATLAGLDPNTAYHYRVRATNAVSTTYGADGAFATAKVPPTVTTDPESGVTASGATLHGTVNARNADTTVTFEYGTTAGYGTTAAGTPGVATELSDTGVSLPLAGLLPNTTYHYRAVGASDGGTAYGDDATFTTDPVPPTAVTEVGGTLTGATSALVYGTVNAHYADTTVTFAYGPTTAYGQVAAADPGLVTGGAETGVSATLTGLVPGTTYHYRVVAESIGGNATGVDRVLVVPPAPPLAVTEAAEGVTLEGATLKGTVNARNEATTVWFEYGTSTAYGSEAGADPAALSGVADTAVALDVAGLEPNTTYHYRVVARNATGTTYGQDATLTTEALPPDPTPDPTTDPTAEPTPDLTPQPTVNPTAQPTPETGHRILLPLVQR